MQLYTPLCRYCMFYMLPLRKSVKMCAVTLQLVVCVTNQVSVNICIVLHQLYFCIATRVVTASAVLCYHRWFSHKKTTRAIRFRSYKQWHVAKMCTQRYTKSAVRGGVNDLLLLDVSSISAKLWTTKDYWQQNLIRFELLQMCVTQGASFTSIPKMLTYDPSYP